MEKREQVFVSSTYLDLVEERREVMQALLMADCFPAGMELFPASTEQRWELIRRVIDESDYYIVIVGGRYGSTDDEGISFTEREYDYAVSIDLPILGFLHGSPGDIPAKDTDLSDTAREKLSAFRSKVEDRMCKHFLGADDLGGKVALSIMAARKQYAAIGWVRGTEALTEETREELLTLRARVAELERDQGVSTAAEFSDVGLADGDDPVPLKFSATLGFKEFRDVRDQVAGEVSLTWNEILASVGPLLLEEDTEKRLLEAVTDKARLRWTNSGDDDGARPTDLVDGENDNYDRMLRFALVTESEHQVLVQLRALNIISQGNKKRSLADQAKYWRLTPSGERRVMALLAARRTPEE